MRSVNLLDFGAIRVFGAKFVRGVIDLYEAVRDNDDAKAHHAYDDVGLHRSVEREDGRAEPVGALPV